MQITRHQYMIHLISFETRTNITWYHQHNEITYTSTDTRASTTCSSPDTRTHHLKLTLHQNMTPADHLTPDPVTWRSPDTKTCITWHHHCLTPSTGTAWPIPIKAHFEVNLYLQELMVPCSPFHAALHIHTSVSYSTTAVEKWQPSTPEHTRKKEAHRRI